jgi:hypothetical protein
MKKHTTIFLTFSALLTFNAFAPQVFWNKDVTLERSPASDELENNKADEQSEFVPPKLEENFKSIEMVELKPEKLDIKDSILATLPGKIEVKEETKRSITDEKPEVVKLDTKKAVLATLPKSVDTAGGRCLKDEQSSLEKRVEKLLADKADILEELETLKKKVKGTDNKKAEPKKEEVLADSSRFNNYNVLSFMSSMTSLFASQNMLMAQMFSMFGQQQDSLQLSPFAVTTRDINYVPTSSLLNSSQVGLGYRYQVMTSPYLQEQEYYRAPSAQTEQVQMRMQPQQMQMQQSQRQAPQAQTEQTLMPHNGFNFQNSSSAMNMERVMIK